MYDPTHIPVEGDYVDHGCGRIVRNGKGTHVFSNGLVYTGQWDKDKMNGEGIYMYVAYMCTSCKHVLIGHVEIT